ncbi:MAG TPA: hypothetical protein PKV80_29400, partial [Leptospiraceae bacterium]|nr:hypothetical protein [Leptospiraceae bacterium]
RICLIYNLKKGTSKVQPKAFKVSETAEYAAKILKKEKTKTMKSLILLKHQYTEKNFSRDSLKNSDILKAQVLFEAAEKADYSAHLALVTMQKTYDPLSRYDDYYYDDKDEDNDNKPEIGDLIDSSLSVNQWFDSKGKSVPFGDMKLKESEIFSSEPFGKGEADEMDKED